MEILLAALYLTEIISRLVPTFQLLQVGYKMIKEFGVVTYIYNTNTWQMETGRPGVSTKKVQNQPRLCEALSQEHKKEQTKPLKIIKVEDKKIK